MTRILAGSLLRQIAVFGVIEMSMGKHVGGCKLSYQSKLTTILYFIIMIIVLLLYLKKSLFHE